MYRRITIATVVMVIVVTVLALCLIADKCYADADIKGYKDIVWGVEYSDVSAHLDYLGEGKLLPLKTEVFPRTAYFTNGEGHGGSSFMRVALFDENNTLIGVKMQAEANGNSVSVYESVLNHLEDQYGKFDVHMVVDNLTGFKETVSWRRMSGNVTFTHTKTGDFSTFSILFTANKKG